MHPAVTRAPLRNVFTMIRTGKLSLFVLNVIAETPKSLNIDSRPPLAVSDVRGNNVMTDNETVVSSEPEVDSTVGDTERKYMRYRVWPGTRSMEVPMTATT